MGVMGGDAWEVPNLPQGTIMQALQTPTVTPASAGNANSNFRTGLATQLASGNFALAIHAIRWNIFPTFPATVPDLDMSFMQVQITENLTATSVQLTDPRSLALEGVGYTSVLETAVGVQSNLYEFLKSELFNPAILTIAQSLNVVASSSTSGLTFDAHANLKYTLVEVTPETQKELIQRISLATQP